jgi:hypothetical protein
MEIPADLRSPHILPAFWRMLADSLLASVAAGRSTHAQAFFGKPPPFLVRSKYKF